MNVVAKEVGRGDGGLFDSEDDDDQEQELPLLLPVLPSLLPDGPLPHPLRPHLP